MNNHLAARLPGLDLLRATAVLLVIGRHAAPCPDDAAAAYRAVMQTWACGGWVGVDLFFVLSGFLISGLLFREHASHGRIHYGHFLVRRGLKIYPPFWLLLAIVATLSHFSGRTPTGTQIAAELLYVQNYWPGVLPHTWSLAVEEHFYLLLPLVLIAVARWGSKARSFAALPQVVFWIALACLSMRCIAATRVERFLHLEHVFPTHLRIDSLLFGVMLSWLWHCRGLSRVRLSGRLRIGLALLGALLLAPAFAITLETSWFLNTFGFTLFWLGSGLLLLAFLGMAATGRWTRALAVVGTHSYSIYLWHIPVRIGCDRMLTDVSAPLRFGIYFAGSIVLGVIMSRLVEVPVLKLRDRLFPSRAVGAQRSAEAAVPSKDNTEPAVQRPETSEPGAQPAAVRRRSTVRS